MSERVHSDHLLRLQGDTKMFYHLDVDQPLVQDCRA